MSSSSSSSPLIAFSFLLIYGLLLQLSIPAFGQRNEINIDPTTTSNNELRFQLIHRHLFDNSAPKTRIERVKDLVQVDLVRVQMISWRLFGYQHDDHHHHHHHKIYKRKDLEISTSSKKKTAPSAVIPISSAAYKGIGQYFVPLRVGTPAKQFSLIVDTGSDLTWLNCRYRCKKCAQRPRTNHHKIFHADKSSSFKSIPCSSELCKNLSFSLSTCPSTKDPCQYDYGYKDGSNARGIYAKETVTVGLTNGRKTRLHNVVVGCSFSTSTGSTFGAADGVLGLGYSDNSFALKATASFGSKFTYCLVDHLSPKNVSSFLTFGNSRGTKHSGSGSSSTNMQYTELLLKAIDGFYPVNVVGVSVGGSMLKIPFNIFDVQSQGGVILDSGTSLTFLAEPAYKIVMTVLKAPLMKFKQEKDDIFEFCFSSVGFNETVVPKLVFHFTGNIRFEPPVKSYVIDVSDGVKCLGFMSNEWPGVSIIGNIMQQNFLWEFDLAGKRLGFAPSTCAQH
ncbi:Peptidase A1 [Macleaya cordata]|uniref:Peptidase A1 n=1 Tax=Macleaya cordata TaxID=56857 RepID=A0A200PT58_MACCD|nr:Peptidase A1 [Macleaya cordata]